MKLNNSFIIAPKIEARSETRIQWHKICSRGAFWRKGVKRVAEENRQRSQGRVQVSAGVQLQLGPRDVLCQIWFNCRQESQLASLFIIGFRLSPPLCGSGVISSQVRHLLFWRGPFSEEGDCYKKLTLILTAAEQWMPWPGKDAWWHQQYQTLSTPSSQCYSDLFVSHIQFILSRHSFSRILVGPNFWEIYEKS